MSFLAPLFLLGALAVSLPVVFHLVRRTSRERVPFSSLMFLLATPPRLTNRSRLEHLLLLLLRCLALVLLAAGFARPFMKRAILPQGSPGLARQLLLIDTSASMRRPNLWQDELAKAQSVLQAAGPSEQVAVYTFDRELKPLVSFDEWQAEPAGARVTSTLQKLAQTSPGWSGTRLGTALIEAAEILDDTSRNHTRAPSRITLITDLQEGSRLAPLQGYEWPKGIEVSVEILKPKFANNAGLELIPDVDESFSVQTNGAIRLRVTNASDSRREQFQIGWAGQDGKAFAGSPTAVYVPAGQSRIVTLAAAAAASESVLLRGDDVEFDNAVFTLPPERRHLKVLYFGSETNVDAKQPLYFLLRAFQEARRQDVQVLQKSVSADIEQRTAQEAALFIVTEALGQGPLGVLKEQLAGGKTGLLVLRDQSFAPVLAGLAGLQHVNLVEIQPKDFALLGTIDFEHPIFTAFADPRFSDFSKIHFWKYRRLEIADYPMASGSATTANRLGSSETGGASPSSTHSLKVLARFDDGDPALVEIGVGRGRLVVLTSGWQPEDSQLALSTKFVPLMYALLELGAPPMQLATRYRVGDEVSLGTVTSAAAGISIRRPDGKSTELGAGQTNFSGTALPGVYAVVSSEPPRRFAVNVDPEESLTVGLTTDELGRLGVPLSQSVLMATREVERKERLKDAELESRQKLWRWLLVLTLAVLLAETWIAARTSRLGFQQQKMTL